MRHFENLNLAPRYHAYRPRVHGAIVDSLQAQIDLPVPLERALDIGCGTGHSTAPLRGLAREVVGLDVSAGMLEVARGAYPDIRFIQAPAEATGEPDHSFDLITCSMVFHWLDQEAFLAEVTRIAKHQSYLCVYNFWFPGEMAGNPDFNAWYLGPYRERFPTPKRNTQRLQEVLKSEETFRYLGKTPVQFQLTRSLEELVGYLSTQSNVSRTVDQGIPLKESMAWLEENVKEFFGKTQETFSYLGTWELAKRVS